MVESSQQLPKQVSTSELIGKFRSKQDLYEYLSVQRKLLFSMATLNFLVQMFLPPKRDVTSDFLRQVFKGTKKLLPRAHVSVPYVPAYNELSVKNLWPDLSLDQTFMVYFPDDDGRKRLPDRSYFLGVLNHVYP